MESIRCMTYADHIAYVHFFERLRRWGLKNDSKRYSKDAIVRCAYHYTRYRFTRSKNDLLFLILPTTFLARANAEEKASTRDVNIQKGFSIQLQPEWELRRWLEAAGRPEVHAAVFADGVVWCVYWHKVPIRNNRVHSPNMASHVLSPRRLIPLWSHGCVRLAELRHLVGHG